MPILSSNTFHTFASSQNDMQGQELFFSVSVLGSLRCFRDLAAPGTIFAPPPCPLLIIHFLLLRFCFHIVPIFTGSPLGLFAGANFGISVPDFAVISR
jgi:hypothetical protein